MKLRKVDHNHNGQRSCLIMNFLRIAVRMTKWILKVSLKEGGMYSTLEAEKVLSNYNLVIGG